MGWEVRVVGDSTDLGMLAEAFTEPDFKIAKQGEEFVITSPDFELLNNPGDIRERAQGYVELLNGAAKLAFESRTPIRIGAIYYCHADGSRAAYVFAEPAEIHLRALSASITVSHLDGTTETYHPADPIRGWMKVASRDAAVTKVLRLLSNGAWDWVNLYRIFEVVAADSGGLEAIESRGWATTKAMRLFKHTANSPGALGIEARHGAESTQPPAKPMSLAEAKSLMLGIVQSWLRAKSGSP